MRDRLVLLVLLVAILGACGKEIGDACFNTIDCSADGDRLCIDATENVEGYCTVRGCDVSTCPEEAVCVRFFMGSFENKQCDPSDPDNPTPTPPAVQCSLDEECALHGRCVARSSEVRFCMRTCGSDGDCRDGYECRDLERMRRNGGQPLLAPGVPLDDDAPKFCAKAP